jgi:hypothetical protein
MFFHRCERRGFISIQNCRQNYTTASFNFRVLRKQTKTQEILYWLVASIAWIYYDLINTFLSLWLSFPKKNLTLPHFQRIHLYNFVFLSGVQTLTYTSFSLRPDITTTIWTKLTEDNATTLHSVQPENLSLKKCKFMRAIWVTKLIAGWLGFDARQEEGLFPSPLRPIRFSDPPNLPPNM